MATDNNNKVLNVPNLRFPEFTEEWRKYKVSDVLDFYSTNSLSWEQLDYNNEDLYNLHYGLIHVGLPILVDIGQNKLPGIKTECKPKNFELCKEGDVAFADASEDTNDVAKAIEFVNLNNHKTVCGLHTIHGRDNKHLTVLGYKGYAFASPLFHNQIRRIAQGTKIYSISSKNFAECYIGIPSKDEQSKIARLLALIDSRIATQNKIIEDLKKLKVAISNKLFELLNQVEYKISDVAQIGRGRVISTLEISKQECPTYPVYSSQTSNNGIMGYLDTYDFEGEYITWTTDGANAGTVFYRNGKFNCTNVCGVLKVNDNIDAYYLSIVLQSATAKYVSTNLANPKLMNNTMSSIKVKLPSLPVQRNWSNTLREIDAKIENEILASNLLCIQKQYLLQQMFI